MPSIGMFPRASEFSSTFHSYSKRINIPISANSPPGLIAATQEDPWSKSGKYALGWVYFSVILLSITCCVRLYHMWTDKLRRALYKEAEMHAITASPNSDLETSGLPTNNSARRFFPQGDTIPQATMMKKESSLSSIALLNNTIALVRWLFYRPLPVLRIRRLGRLKKRDVALPSLGVIVIVIAATAFVTLYCFLAKPLYYESIRYGSPPLAIRAGMIAVAMLPWIVALSMKANMISFITGIGHERLNVLHRWAGYICLFLSLVHTVPFYITPVWDHGALNVFKSYFPSSFYVYGTGVAALVPLIFLCVHSLPFLRNWMYELFAALHVPVSIVFLGMMFWHCHNYLTSWNYLFATMAIWLVSYGIRLFYLNWSNPWRLSWLIGEEAAITILPENAVKVTVPTQIRWSPGQYVYLRMPGISIFENHPFTISSLCSEDFLSDYGENYRDMTLVFRPFGGFTRKVLNTATENGPYKTYRAFIDGPYGGMQRDLAAFDTVVLIAGGSGITAIVSQLLDLIKKMRDGKAVTKSVNLIWALKRPDTVEWFKEEIRICREYAPPDSVRCQFFITAAKRHIPGSNQAPTRPLSDIFHNKINDAFQGIASKRNSAFIRDEAAGDIEKELELRRENEDTIGTLPQPYFPPPPKVAHAKNKPNLKLELPPSKLAPIANVHNMNDKSFDFGFPSTPTDFQKNLMRFAFLPSGNVTKDGWRTEYGRPDIPYMLRQLSREFGKRACVFVCGPPEMRTDVATTVAGLQSKVWKEPSVDEIYLHTENYAI